MVDRDPTPSELAIKLEGISDQLKDLSNKVFTTDLFGAWRDGNEARIRRIEDDQKEWARVSTQAHADLAGQITAAVAADKSEREKMALAHQAAIDKVAGDLDGALDEQKDIREKQDARRYDLVKAIAISLLVAVLGVIGNMAVTLLRGG